MVSVDFSFTNVAVDEIESRASADFCRIVDTKDPKFIDDGVGNDDGSFLSVSSLCSSSVLTEFWSSVVALSSSSNRISLLTDAMAAADWI